MDHWKHMSPESIPLRATGSSTTIVVTAYQIWAGIFSRFHRGRSFGPETRPRIATPTIWTTSILRIFAIRVDITFRKYPNPPPRSRHFARRPSGPHVPPASPVRDRPTLSRPPSPTVPPAYDNAPTHTPSTTDANVDAPEASQAQSVATALGMPHSQ